MYFRFPKVLMPIGPVRIASTSLSPTLKLFTHLHFHPNMASTSTMFSSLPSNVNERRMELFNLGLDAKLSIPGSDLEKTVALSRQHVRSLLQECSQNPYYFVLSMSSLA
jgi:hypothetical protein